ncbi:hypothetical protein [Pseudophaeobacter flagellatus]|uniref:hypothetical protein n=1 Tax=Pseudophaeobacter flagellatus TaxID=2899119 RepID=UPI001E49DDDA|nr:hypothetical protein [Pseudophaeobacter flagellatus]MCD9147865.1 hypothetical protein [Pseudophaeobacter flagellatus]
MATEATGDVGHPDDTNYAGDGWKKVWGFFDGLAGVADRVEGVTEDLSDTSDHIVDAKRGWFELRRDERDAETADMLAKSAWQRGDNVELTKYWALGAAALVAVLIIAGK